MRRHWVHLAMVVLAAGARVAVAGAPAAVAQEVVGGHAVEVPAEAVVPYTMTVPVNEVSVMFQAADFSGVPIPDLAEGDVRVLDNGKQQRQIVSFEFYRDLPIRAGLLLDTSRSVLENLRRNQGISTEYVRQFFRRQAGDRPGDEAFVMGFDFEPKLVEDWTGDGEVLAASIRNIAEDRESRMGGTAIFDAVYKACRDQFGRVGEQATGNFLLLFSDGLDNASQARIEDDVQVCQQTNTVIYVFSGAPKSMFIEGQKTLSDLATETGGRIFFEQTADGIRRDLRSIEANLRSQYRLIFKPAKLKADGSFHRIQLDSPSRGGVITARSGYYAPR
jgi:Ca-activated chloride channel homolog